MSLISNAQSIEQIVVDDMDSHDHAMVFYPKEPDKELVLEMHDPEMHEHEHKHDHAHAHAPSLEVNEPGEIQFVIDLGAVPGVTALDDVKERDLEVSENPEESAEDPDENDAKKSKKPAKWDWESKGASGFVAWIQEKISEIPKHSGYDTAGIERAVSYLDKLDSEISKAMRLDLDGELDADKVEEVRAKIYDGIERLNARHDKVNKKNKGKKKKKTAEDESGTIVKEGQKVMGVSGMVITAPLFISTIVRTCINGAISAGHDIEDMFAKFSEKFDLTTREKFECMQLFADMGYPMRRDRGLLVDEDYDSTSSDNFDWAANYQA